MSALAMVLTEWRLRRIRFSRRLLIAAAVGTVAILPQVWFFVTVHYPQSYEQTSHNLAKVLGLGLIGSLLGPALFPANPLGILFLAAALIAIGAGLLGRSRMGSQPLHRDPVFIFSASLFVIGVLTGIAMKERNLALLNVLIWGWLATNLGRLPRIPAALLGVAGTFTLGVGTRNLMLSRHTGMPSLNMPVYEVMDQIRSDAASRHVPIQDVWLVTWNDPMALYGRFLGVHVVSPYMRDELDATTSFPMFAPKGKMVVLLSTEQQGWRGDTWNSARNMAIQTHATLSGRRTANICPDENAKMEARLIGRYVPTYMVGYESGISTHDIHMVFRGSW
jgi:hypothetical protein